MSRSYRTVAIAVAILALCASSFAAQGKKAVPGKATSIAGTLQKVDGQTLTVQTPKGAETVMLAPAAQIRMGKTTMTAADLSTHTGSRVTIRYTENNGQKQAQSVTLAAAPAAKVAKK